MKREMMTTDNIIELVKSYAKGKKYVEIGIFRGVLLSKVAEVAKSAIGIDNFSQFDDGTNKAAVLARITKNCTILEGDCFDGAILSQIKGVDVIFYDAGHSYDDTMNAFRHYYTKLKKGGIFILDDWNMPHIERAANDFGVEPILQHLTEKNASDDWWNGIAVFKRS